MNISNYTFLFQKNNEYFIFNSLSKAFLQIDKISFDILVEKQDQNLEILVGDIDTELYNELVLRLMLCENHKDEFLVCKSKIMHNRSINTAMHLTLAPTLDCCFSCFYCFEKNKDKTYITSDILDAIVSNIKRRESIQTIHLSWFGGEPLMAINKMQEFYEKFRPTFKGRFTSDIVTTAFYVNKEIINILKEIEVSSMQITIDGMEDSHNSIKFTRDCNNSFRKIISNIDLLVEQYPELKIVIRVNITKKNAAEYVELFQFLSKRYRGKKIFINASLVKNRANDISICDLFNNNDFSKFSLDLWQNHKIPTSWLMYDSTQSECAIRNLNALVIDPKGRVYKCWEKIGDPKHIIGELDKDGNIVTINQNELNRNLYGADPLEDEKCKKCSYLPLCFGGCPIQRIENEFEGNNNYLCTTYKKNIDKWLSTYLEFKKIAVQ